MEPVIDKSTNDANIIQMIVLNTEDINDNIVVKDDPSPSLDTAENNDGLVDHSLQISRHYITLLDEYRFLLSCIMKTCNCHSNFDYQFFLRKLEQRYNILNQLLYDDKSVTNLLINQNNELTLEQLMEKSSKKIRQPDNNVDSKGQKFIHRVKICERSKPSQHQSQPKMMKKEHILFDTDDNNTVDDDNQINNQDDVDDAGDNGSNLDDIFDPHKSGISLKDSQIAYKCSYSMCEYLSFSQEALIQHLRDHQTNPATVTTMKTTEIESKREVVYVCEQCGKEFAGQKWLDNHVENVHASAKIYHCNYPDCNYSTKFRCVIEDHKRRHSKIKDFKCTWPGCDSEFVTKRDMVAHLNFSHKGIRNYQCTWPNCDASFKDSNRLKHHYYTHTGERPYKCDVCDSSFKQLPHLHKHRRIHTANNPNNNNNRTISTRLSSSNYVCPESSCQRKFRDAEDLENHQRTFEHYLHEVNHIYQCLISNCDQLFDSHTELEQHINDKHSFLMNDDKTKHDDNDDDDENNEDSMMYEENV